MPNWSRMHKRSRRWFDGGHLASSSSRMTRRHNSPADTAANADRRGRDKGACRGQGVQEQEQEKDDSIMPRRPPPKAFKRQDSVGFGHDEAKAQECVRASVLMSKECGIIRLCESE